MVRSVLLTDADNTLWDTNRVFAHAQLQLLKGVEKIAGGRAPGPDRLAFVRRIDQALAKKDHRGLKYPPALLVRALFSELSRKKASALSREQELALSGTFAEALNAKPRLRPGVRKTMARLVEQGVVIWVVSEGHRDRVLAALEDYRLTPFISRTITALKTPLLFRRLARLAGDSARVVCVGDQLDRDIAPAKSAGMLTVYFPGGFTPEWTDHTLTAHADVVATSFSDVIPLLGIRKAA